MIRFAFSLNRRTAYKAVKYCATGVFGYLIQKDDREVFNIRSVVSLNPDIYLRGFDRKLVHKHFDGEMTLVPGNRRTFVDEFGKIDGYYEYVSVKGFNIVAQKSKACVLTSENGWIVFDGKKKLAEICKIPESKRRRFVSSGYDMEESYLISIDKTTDRSLYPYIMAIPLLKF